MLTVLYYKKIKTMSKFLETTESFFMLVFFPVFNFMCLILAAQGLRCFEGATKSPARASHCSAFSCGARWALEWGGLQ